MKERKERLVNKRKYFVPKALLKNIGGIGRFDIFIDLHILS